MKRRISAVVLLVGSLFLTANLTAAQSTNTSARPTQEQSLQDLVNEVRQLRAMLQRINVTVYKTNVVMERLKIQQDVVARQARDLDDVREKLGEIRTEIMKLKEVVKSRESGVAAGTENPDALADFKLTLEELVQREQRLVMRETQLINELSIGRSKLSESTIG